MEIIPGNWRERFGKVTAGAAREIVASEQPGEHMDVVFEYGNLLLDGVAKLHASAIDADFRPLVVWDGRKGDGPGGTAALVAHWRSREIEPEIIDLQTLARSSTPTSRSSARDGRIRSKPAGRAGARVQQRIMGLLFADVVNYSDVPEIGVPVFVDEFLGGIEKLVESGTIRPEVRNSWGDAIYMAFDSVEKCGCLALQLQDWLKSRQRRQAAQQPLHQLNLRIALHAGPACPILDPIIGRKSYTGFHVTRAARIEPVTEPGHVYASEEFAALAAAHRVTSFECDFVERMPLAKDAGVHPIYRLRWGKDAPERLAHSSVARERLLAKRGRRQVVPRRAARRKERPPR